jgi:putative FmdB family regulatory protein
MPLYEYECGRCGNRSEVIQRVGDPPPEGCSECGGELKRLLSAPAFQFKGTGWYVTDYARKGTPSGDGAQGAGSDKAAKVSSDKKEHKPDSGAKAEKAKAS